MLFLASFPLLCTLAGFYIKYEMLICPKQAFVNNGRDPWSTFWPLVIDNGVGIKNKIQKNRGGGTKGKIKIFFVQIGLGLPHTPQPHTILIKHCLRTKAVDLLNLQDPILTAPLPLESSPTFSSHYAATIVEKHRQKVI